MSKKTTKKAPAKTFKVLITENSSRHIYHAGKVYEMNEATKKRIVDELKAGKVK